MTTLRRIMKMSKKDGDEHSSSHINNEASLLMETNNENNLNSTISTVAAQKPYTGKKRGRKRKVNGYESASALNGLKNGQSLTLPPSTVTASLRNGVGGEEAVKIKRPRGRPRIHKRESDVVDRRTPPPPPPGPAPVIEQVNGNGPVTNLGAAELNGTNGGFKKKRGRKKKLPIPDDTLSSVPTPKLNGVKSVSHLSGLTEEKEIEVNDSGTSHEQKRALRPIGSLDTISSSISLTSQKGAQTEKIRKKPGRKKGWKKNKNQAVNGVDPAGLQAPIIQQTQWVQCDLCSKWYELPSFIKSSQLPQHWYCELISWNGNTKEYNKALCAQQKLELENHDSEKKADNTLRQAKAQDQPSLTPLGAAFESAQSVNTSLQTLGPTKEDKWVACDKCKQWRRMPDQVNLDKLPKKWFCEMNVYDHRFNSCDKPQEEYNKAAAYQVAQDGDLKLIQTPFGNTALPPTVSRQNSVPGAPKLNKTMKVTKKRQLEKMCVYGVEDKILRKNRKNPQTFKELIWWHFNDFSSQEFEQFRKEQVVQRYKNHSCFTNTKKRRSESLRFDTSFSRLFFGRKNPIGSLGASPEKQNNLSEIIPVSNDEQCIKKELAYENIQKLINKLPRVKQDQSQFGNKTSFKR
eukprot:augustus_masked-scaffold_13-processed-gene-7.51-mRNA-1 protein AED:0.08 eAED:0.08 QI:0/-1/0/1/-1/1/1/0/629